MVKGFVCTSFLSDACIWVMALKYSLLPYVPKKNHIVYPTILVRLIWTDFSIKCLIQFNFTAGQTSSTIANSFMIDSYVLSTPKVNIAIFKVPVPPEKINRSCSATVSDGAMCCSMFNLVKLSCSHHGDKPETQIDTGIFFSNAIHQSI